MDFALSPEDEAFRDELRAWLDEHLPPFLEKEAAEEATTESGGRSTPATNRRRAAWQRELNEGRWAAIHWPAEYGGRARHRHAAGHLLGGDGRVPHPGHLQHQRHLADRPHDHHLGHRRAEGPLAAEHPRGRTSTGARASREPDAGNDLANLRTTAILDGDDYVVNGQKIWISTAHLAKWGLFLLRTDPTAIERGAKHEGITAFIVDMETPGIEIRPIRDMTGEEMFNEIFFTDARIPVDCRLGDEGEGWMVAMGTLGFERVGIAGQISMLGRRPAGHDRGGPHRSTPRPWTTRSLPTAWPGPGPRSSWPGSSRCGPSAGSSRARSPGPRCSSPRSSGPTWPRSWPTWRSTCWDRPACSPQGGPDAVDRGKWTRLYSFQRYSTIGGGSTEVQKNIIADRAIKLPGQARLS